MSMIENEFSCWHLKTDPSDRGNKFTKDKTKITTTILMTQEYQSLSSIYILSKYLYFEKKVVTQEKMKRTRILFVFETNFYAWHTDNYAFQLH